MTEQPDFKEIKLEDKQLFDDFFKKYPPQASEYTFTNLFCWRESKKHEFSVFDGHLLVSFDSRKRFYQPVGDDPAGVIKKVLELFPDSSFERVEKRVADKLSSDLNVAEDRDQSDYVYLVSDLVELTGRKYAGKRNFINRCKNYDPVVCVLNAEQVQGFREVLEKWHSAGVDPADKILLAEKDAVSNALEHFEALNLVGICVQIKGEIEAFAIGEPLNNDTYVEHFEKANADITGIYQFLLNEFAKAIKDKAQFLNREQDLGVPGLRKSKLSYSPVRMVEKYSVKK